MSADCFSFARVAAGDSVALGRLLHANYTFLERHIGAKLPARLQSSLSVEDVRQETFTKAFRAIKKGQFEARSEREFAGWLKTIADNCLKDAIKHRARQKQGGKARHVVIIGHGDDRGSINGLIQQLADSVNTASKAAAIKEAVRAMNVFLAQLPAEQRRALQLHELDGHSLKDTARRMSRSEDAVRGLLHRARKKLREAMGNSSQWFSKK